MSTTHNLCPLHTHTRTHLFSYNPTDQSALTECSLGGGPPNDSPPPMSQPDVTSGAVHVQSNRPTWKTPIDDEAAEAVVWSEDALGNPTLPTNTKAFGEYNELKTH